MARCYENCKYNWCNITCRKYNEIILTSINPFHKGLLIHPLEDLSMYYRYENNDIGRLIEVADKFADDDVSKNIIKQYKQKGYISFKQRKFLIYKLLNRCFECKEHAW